MFGQAILGYLLATKVARACGVEIDISTHSFRPENDLDRCRVEWFAFMDVVQYRADASYYLQVISKCGIVTLRAATSPLMLRAKSRFLIADSSA